MVKNAISQIHLKRYIIGACGTGNPTCNNLLMYGSGDTSTPPPKCPFGGCAFGLVKHGPV